MSISEFIEDLRVWWEYICHGHPGCSDDVVEQVPPPAPHIFPKTKRDPLDKESPNLFIGKILQDGILKCEVVDVHNTNIHVKILEIYWERMSTYLDVGKIYPVFKHSGWNDQKIQVWEIAPKHMKRDTSQVILQWEEQLGWVWDLDM